MIDSVTFTPGETVAAHPFHLSWANQLEYFQRQPKTKFKPGLNIIYGANGSGKSTVLGLLAHALAAKQGGTSVVTSSWMGDLFEYGKDVPKLDFEVVHDGQPVMYFDARAQEGLFGGGFDDDFFDLGLANTMAKGSTGQLGLRRIDRMLQVLTKQEKASFPSEFKWKVDRTGGSTSAKRRIAAMEALLSAKLPVGPKTMLFDEPESGFSLMWQAGVWKNIFSKVDPKEFQLIIATHSPFALQLPGAHYIEMQQGAILEAEVAVASLLSRFQGVG